MIIVELQKGHNQLQGSMITRSGATAAGGFKRRNRKLKATQGYPTTQAQSLQPQKSGVPNPIAES